MISIEKCKKILNVNGNSYTDEQIIKIREFLYQLAEIEYSQFKERNKEGFLLNIEPLTI